MNGYNPNIHHRKSIRLKGYDYSRAGLYFIAICVHNRQCLFGEIVNNEMVLNDFGNIAHRHWEKLWQRNYHDHIIRDEQSYHRIANYIINNPLNWKTDKFRK